MNRLLKTAICLILCLSSCQQKKEWQFPYLVWGFAIEGFPITEAMLTQLKEETGVSSEIVLFYLQWSKDEPKGLFDSLENIWNRKAIPCLTWEPMFTVNGRESMIPYQEILEGKHDAYIKFISEEIKKFGKPLMIRFAHEMNLDRYHWGTTKPSYGKESPEIYVKMHRYLVDFFRRNNVDNALWVFCPNVDSIPNRPWNQVKNYYPGDQYVDLLGMDGYNWEKAGKERSFEAIFYNLFHSLKKIAPQKPIFVFETATATAKSNWIKEAVKTAKKWELQGMIWFHVSKEHDWRFDKKDADEVRSGKGFQDFLLNRLKNTANS